MSSTRGTRESPRPGSGDLTQARSSALGLDAERADVEGVIGPEAAPQAVKHVPIPADDAAPGIGHYCASIDPPRGEAGGPHDLDGDTRRDRDEDEVIARRRDASRHEQSGRTAEVKVRGLRGDMQATHPDR